MFATALTQSQRRLTASLDKSRARRESGLFKAEGTKCVLDTLNDFTLEYLIASHSWIEEHHEACECMNGGLLLEASRADLERVSHLSTAPDVVAVYHIPVHQLKIEQLKESLIIALDDIQDPGNLGTIVRLADWFGIDDIICSRATADIYNPKSVMATMGAIGRVKVHYTDLASTLERMGKMMPLYGTFLNGNNLFHESLTTNGVVVMGNEGRGISTDIGALIQRRLTIPSGRESGGSESLNVAMATSIVISQFKSR